MKLKVEVKHPERAYVMEQMRIFVENLIPDDKMQVYIDLFMEEE